MSGNRAIIAVCGKGGVGKTAVTAMLAKAFITEGTHPVLLIDADPAGGLVSAIGEEVSNTLTEARAEIINSARRIEKTESVENLANQIDYMVMQALVERDDYSLMSMGRNLEKGCFCPANTLLRNAIDVIANQYELVLIDAEAGLEQISRQVTKHVTNFLVVVDGSKRSLDTLQIIREMVGNDKVLVVHNRKQQDLEIENLIGAVSEDETLKEYDRKGLPLWSIPEGCKVSVECKEIAKRIYQKLSA